ncbi:hypothetical protein NAP1_05645 [Erythrobacter sp. NAP1]|uniref:TadE/TadG family type IV pilus assembly protein n=1 Tax=Erythrobacter sp. NAP1 TaxID=237727 RepID=UPI0000686960|nr:TadE family protein [Erythrobacter sp. NAP1]EAQ30235.1 hypothetical protein NAP1_05645 [Erythrobacter sp. NAP1]
MTKNPVKPAKTFANRMRSLWKDNSAVAMVEFAFTAPLVLGLGMMGTETAYFTITHMQVSQIAMQVADNASRVGENDVLVARKVFEDDINGTLVGAEKLGARYSIYENGRIIISSLQDNELNDGNSPNGQTIRWQRCRGAKVIDSQYGEEGVGADDNSFPGMGGGPRRNEKIKAESGTAVIFVEVYYTYESVTPFEMFDGTELEYTAAFNVRDKRDISQIYNREDDPAPVARCNVYSANRPS